MVTPVVNFARGTARVNHCLGNLRQLGYAWQLYADSHRTYCMPQVWMQANPPIYWWGTNGKPPDYTLGLLYPYLPSEVRVDDIYDCPEQPWGSYIPQGVSRQPTSTYGYNGLYFAPAASGWSVTKAKVMWRQIDEIEGPGRVCVFGDALLDWSVNRGLMVTNNCYLDGPKVPLGQKWVKNSCPTLAFRHRGRACIVFADGHGDAVSKTLGVLTSPPAQIGYIGTDNAPHYIPDYQAWF